MQRSEGFLTAADGTRLHLDVLGDAPQVVLAPNGTYLVDDLAPIAERRRLAVYDPRNRGESEAAAGGGILQDVDDMRAVAVHLTAAPVDVIGHSFAGLLAALYAKAWPQGVRRLVLLGPLGPHPDREYPPTLINRDETFVRVMRELGALLPQRANWAPEEFCEKVCAVLGALYVTSPADAGRIRWGRCGLENERNGLRYFQEVTLPSIRALGVDRRRSRRDRSAGPRRARDEGSQRAVRRGTRVGDDAPNARLLSIEGGGHAPWIRGAGTVASGHRAISGWRMAGRFGARFELNVEADQR